MFAAIPKRAAMRAAKCCKRPSVRETHGTWTVVAHDLSKETPGPTATGLFIELTLYSGDSANILSVRPIHVNCVSGFWPGRTGVRLPASPLTLETRMTINPRLSRAAALRISALTLVFVANLAVPTKATQVCFLCDYCCTLPDDGGEPYYVCRMSQWGTYADCSPGFYGCASWSFCHP